MTDDLITLARRAVACKRWRWMPGMLGVEMEDDGTVHAEADLIRITDSFPRYSQVRGCLTTRSRGQGRWDVEEHMWTDIRSGGSFPVIPDLSDPATLGCLIALVREAWRDPSLSVVPKDESIPLTWELCDDGLASPVLNSGCYYTSFTSEATALIAALEAAP